MRSLLLVVAICLVFTGAFAQSSTPFATIPGELRRYQTASGGFVERLDDSLPSLQATNGALKLASLFAIGNRVDLKAALSFVESRRHASGGFADEDGLPSLEATHAALSALMILSPQRTGGQEWNFVRSLLNANGFASSRPGQPASLEATVLFFELLDVLGSKQEPEVQSAVTLLRSWLSEREREEDKTAYFEDPESKLEPAVFNSLCVRLGVLLSHDFGRVSFWHDYYKLLQDADSGCFFAGPDSTTVSLEAALHSVRAVSALSLLSSNVNSFNFLDAAALHQCIERQTAGTVSAVSDAHVHLALTPFVRNYFDVTASFSSPDGRDLNGEIVIQGEQIVPALSIRTEFGPHPDLHAVVNFEHQELRQSVEMQFDAQSFTWLGTGSFDTSTVLGPFGLTIHVRKPLPFIAGIGFYKREVKRIGYGLEILPEVVNVVTGHEVAPGGAVLPGTQFNMKVNLYTRLEPSITHGQFSLVLSVLDSSGAAIHTDTIDGEDAEGSLSFSYLFNREDLPPGALVFDFSVEGLSGGAHSRRTLAYQIDSSLVAADLSLDNARVALDARVTGSFQPVLIGETGAVVHLSADGNDKRKFFLDLRSSSGRLVHSVPTVANDQGTYTFSFAVPKSVDMLGQQLTLSVRYQMANKAELSLQNYDTSADSEAGDVTLTIESQLQFQPTGPLPAASYQYGDQTEWVFAIVDAVSGFRLPAKGPQDYSRSGVFVVVKHDGFVSYKAAAQAHGNDLVAVWRAGPDSRSGPAVLAIEVLDADGNALPVAGEASLAINIAGSVSVSSKVHSTASGALDRAAFIVDFSLQAAGKEVREAHIQAAVARNGVLFPNLVSVPVAQTPDGFAVSWTMPLKDARSGHYEIRLLRQAEFLTAVDDGADQVAIAASLKPVVTIEFDHSSAHDFSIGVPIYYVAISIFGYLSYYVLSRYQNKKI